MFPFNWNGFPFHFDFRVTLIDWTASTVLCLVHLDLIEFRSSENEMLLGWMVVVGRSGE